MRRQFSVQFCAIMHRSSAFPCKRCCQFARATYYVFGVVLVQLRKRDRERLPDAKELVLLVFRDFLFESSLEFFSPLISSTDED